VDGIIIRLCEERICALLKYESDLFSNAEVMNCNASINTATLMATKNACAEYGISVKTKTKMHSTLREEIEEDAHEQFLYPLLKAGYRTVPSTLLALSNSTLGRFGRSHTLIKEYVASLNRKYNPVRRNSRRSVDINMSNVWKFLCTGIMLVHLNY
jgi:hypothetical protein